MADHPKPATALDEPTAYAIRLAGCLGSEWADWFGCLSITPIEGGESLMISPAIDQAALYGVLKKIRDLGLRLRSVNPVARDAEGAMV